MKFPLISTGALLLFLTWSSTCTSSGLEQFMSGAVPIREPDNHHPIMYSSVIPLLYKFQLPVWDLHSMKIQFWKEHNNCTESDSYEAGYPCPIIFHINTLIESFASNITYWKNLFLEKDFPSEFLIDPSILWDKEVCTSLRIEPHFQAFQASSKQLNKYLEVLTQCAERNGTVFNQKTVNLGDSLISLENQYHDTFASYTADYWGKLSNEASRESSSVVAWTALEAALMIHQYAETQRWSHAITSCQNHQIPWSLIDAESLREMLVSVKSNYLEEESQEFAIDLEDFSKYFKLPVADCIFGDDDTFIVRILVPVIPEEAQSQNHFVRFHPIPFITEGRVCSIWEGRESIPFNTGLNGILPCSCDLSDIFCKGWDTHSYESCTAIHGQEEICIHALTSDIEEDIIKYCPLVCNPFDEGNAKHLEIIMKSDSEATSKIIPTMVKDSTLNSTYMECTSPITSLGRAMEFRFEPVGAYEMTFPTGCSLIEMENSRNGSFIHNIVSEIEGVTINQLMPYHWRRGITFEEASEVTEEETVMGSVQKMEGVEPKIAFLASKLQQVNEVCRKSGGGDAVIWVLIGVSLIANIVLGVMVLRFSRWKVEIMRNMKSDRMIYNITDEDDFPIHEGMSMRNPLCPPGSSRNCSSPHDK